MKRSILIFLLAIGFGSVSSYGQDRYADSLTTIINNAANDSVRISEMLNLSKYYFASNPDKAISIATEALNQSEEKVFYG